MQEIKKPRQAEAVFVLRKRYPPKAYRTISTDAGLCKEQSCVHYFSLGAHTDISAETYDCPALYIGAGGDGGFCIGEGERKKTCSLAENSILFVSAGTLCGVFAGTEGFVYTEILLNDKEANMNELLKAGEVFCLKDLVEYEENSIVNIDLVSGIGVKLMILAFDEGQALSEHRAPGDALVFALEGKAVIGYEGNEYTLSAGENFRFEKNGLHSVKAVGRFKMALLLMRE